MRWICPLKDRDHTQYESLAVLGWMGNGNAQAILIALYYEEYEERKEVNTHGKA